MDEKNLHDICNHQKEIAEILGLLQAKGYEFTEREKGRIEQMLIDGLLCNYGQAKNRLPNAT